MTSRLQLLILAASIFLGVLFPTIANLFKPLLYPTVFLLFLFAILQVQFFDVLSEVLNRPSTVLVLVWQLLALPLLAILILSPVLSDHWYLFTLVVLSTSSITAITALARIFELNDAMALSVCILGTLFMPLPLYVVINFVAGIEASIDLDIYAGRIILYIVIPFILAALFRHCAGERMMYAVERRIPSIVLCLLMIFGLCVMDGVRDMIDTEPMHLMMLVILAFALSLTIQITTYLALRFLGERDVKTACLACAYRNMGVVAAVTGSSLGEYFLIFVGVWQLPMYTLPFIFERFYRIAHVR